MTEQKLTAIEYLVAANEPGIWSNEQFHEDLRELIADYKAATTWISVMGDILKMYFNSRA